MNSDAITVKMSLRRRTALFPFAHAFNRLKHVPKHVHNFIQTNLLSVIHTNLLYNIIISLYWCVWLIIKLYVLVKHTGMTYVKKHNFILFGCLALKILQLHSPCPSV